MSYTLEVPKRFKKSLARCLKRGLDENRFKEVIRTLVNGEPLPDRYRAHKLSGKYEGCWECHIQPDWLLIWMQNDEKLILVLIDTGSHSDLF